MYRQPTVQLWPTTSKLEIYFCQLGPEAPLRRLWRDHTDHDEYNLFFIYYQYLPPLVLSVSSHVGLAGIYFRWSQMMTDSDHNSDYCQWLLWRLRITDQRLEVEITANKLVPCGLEEWVVVTRLALRDSDIKIEIYVWYQCCEFFSFS